MKSRYWTRRFCIEYNEFCASVSLCVERHPNAQVISRHFNQKGMSDLRYLFIILTVICPFRYICTALFVNVAALAVWHICWPWSASLTLPTFHGMSPLDFPLLHCVRQYLYAIVPTLFRVSYSHPSTCDLLLPSLDLLEFLIVAECLKDLVLPYAVYKRNAGSFPGALRWCSLAA